MLTDTETYTLLMNRIWRYWHKISVRKISWRLEEAWTWSLESKVWKVEINSQSVLHSTILVKQASIIVRSIFPWTASFYDWSHRNVAQGTRRSYDERLLVALYDTYNTRSWRWFGSRIWSRYSGLTVRKEASRYAVCRLQNGVNMKLLVQLMLGGNCEDGGG
jgi:hypothetical protein